MHRDAPRGRLIYLLTEDWFFLSHFADRGVAARQAGYDVLVAAREGKSADAIRALGLRFAPLPFERGSLNPLVEVATLRAIQRLYAEEKPDLVHHVGLKPIIYGTLAAHKAQIVNAPVGMGYVFTSERLLARLLRPLVGTALRLLLNPAASRVVFENRDDFAASIEGRMVRRDAAVLIRGAGVDTRRFVPVPEPAGPVRVVLVGRMLRDKGIIEFVEAARRLRSARSEIEFILVGTPDPQNHTSLSETEIDTWVREGLVSWLGFRANIAGVMADSHIVVLPSYREGLPKVLLEAMACGRAVVTTDVPGCREAVQHGDNGLLVPARDAGALADAIARLARDPELRRRLGAAGRRKAETEFSSEKVTGETLDLYAEMLPRVGVPVQA